MKKIALSSDSVSMGDDTFEHSLIIEISENWKISKILKEIEKLNYLPKIRGGKATWSVACEKPLAILAQEWDDPILICQTEYPNPDTIYYVAIDKLHFNYHAQLDPELVLEVLKQYRNA